MKLVFLDVDGPLNNWETNQSILDKSDYTHTSSDAVYDVYGGIIYIICPWMLNNLYDVLRAHRDVKLIGISSWFRGGDKNCIGVQKFQELTGLVIDDVINDTGGGPTRFICAQKYAESCGVDKYVIIDDLKYEHPKLVKIHREGLSREKALEAIRMLE